MTILPHSKVALFTPCVSAADLKRGLLLCVVTLCALVTLDCKTTDARSGSAGQDYLNQEFQCSELPLPQEGAGFELLRDQIRNLWKAENRKSADIVFTGDSIMALFAGPRLGFLPGMNIANRAIGGETSAGLLARLDQDVIPLNPRVVVIVIGGNDILAGRCMRAVLQNTAAVFTKLHSSLPRAKIVMVSIPPVVSWKPNGITPYYNRKLEYLTQDERVTYLDLWPTFSNPETPGLKKEFHYILPNGRADQVHFNEEGYREFARLLLPLL